MAGDSRATAYEWVLSNALGGYALGAADLINHRKYHGLLIASDATFKRVHLVSSIEEKVEVEAARPSSSAGGRSFFLDSVNYPNVVHPDGYTRLVRHFPRPFPSFLYSDAGGSRAKASPEILILKTIQLHAKSNYAVVRYKNLGRPALKLTLRPKFTLRDHHFVHPPGFWDASGYTSRIEDALDAAGRRETAGGTRGWISADGVKAFVVVSGNAVAANAAARVAISSDPVIYRNVIYPTEASRGHESAEDVASPFRITMTLASGEEEFVIFADQDVRDVEGIICETSLRYGAYALPRSHPLRFEGDSERILAAAQSRPVSRREYSFPAQNQQGSASDSAADGEFDHAGYMSMLNLAMREFVASDNLIAGFPWFGAWGRDAMISLEALPLLEGGTSVACRILARYADHMRSGMIPNTFGEGGAGRNYDAVDAPLWFGIRAMEMLEHFDRRERAAMLEAVSQVIANYLFNSSLPFHVDAEDGLVSLRPQSGLALTWMDARVSGRPVTPRYGKPIEINALWYNLLRFFMAASDGAVLLGNKSIAVPHLRLLAGKAKRALGAFCDGGGFADRIENGAQVMDLRPNYIVALSLPYDIFTREQMSAGYEVARAKLLTPVGLRSLSPDDLAFRKRYMGDQTSRDMAYHQGTVWAWLLLPMAKVAYKLYAGDKARLRRELEGLVFAFRDGFMRGETASVAEIYDGDAPGNPKGAPAQCWSVAAVLLIEKMIEELEVGR